MSNRDDLLDGARTCLYEKGYARTTARDIATAAGVSLAAIGYHFGSKEALLNAALRREIEAWGDQLDTTEHGDTSVDMPAEKRFAVVWDGMVSAFGTSSQLWAIQFELLATLYRNPGLRDLVSDANGVARRALLEHFGAAAPKPGEPGSDEVGALYHAMLIGLAALAAADPDQVPSGADLLDAMRTVARRVGPEQPATGRKQFALVLSSGGDPADSSACGTWNEDMRERGVWRATVGLDQQAESRTIKVREDAVVLGDGPFAETKDLIGGFALIECADLDEAVQIAAEHPWASVGQISVRPVVTA